MVKQSTAVEGTLEINGSAGGYLRQAERNYGVNPTDAVVPRGLCEQFRLRGGETVRGQAVQAPSRKGRADLAVHAVETVNGLDAADYSELKPFEDLTAIDPNRPLAFETPGGPLSMRVIDLMTPIGFGQRGLIVAPPRTGKTILLQQMAEGIATNNPQAYMMVLLIDERPEEVTDMRRKVRGEVIASSNDRDVASHVRVARLMIQKAKRMVECGRDVVVLLDSLTRVGRAFNAFIRHSGRIMSGGLDIGALTEPKAIFGAARNVEGGGSLTIVSSALIETGSRMDEVIFNEFKGTGNMEIMLCREMANRRLWPAIDLDQSGTRKEHLLLSPEAMEVSHKIRRQLAGQDRNRAMETLLAAMGKYATNADFVAKYSPSTLR